MRLLTRGLFAASLLLCSAGIAAADPLLVTGGAIVVYKDGAYFAPLVTTGGDFAGDTEGTPVVALLSGFPGTPINLSSSATNQLTGFSVLTPARVDMAGAVDFHFTAGSGTVPTVAEAARNGASVFAPFTFTGTLTGWATYAAMDAGAPPLFQYQLYGSGTAEARFFPMYAAPGQPRTDAPLSTGGVTYRFNSQPPSVPTPEPGTIVLLAGGLGAVIARRRR